MNSPDVISEDELLENDDEKDLDFDIRNYVDEIKNDDSYDELLDNQDDNVNIICKYSL